MSGGVLQEAMGIGDNDKIPQGRFGRLARLVSATAKAGSSMVFSSDASIGAAKSAAMLGQLRGLATKVGQMASYVDGLIPENHRDTYEQAMGKLQAAAPESSPTEIRDLIHSELGAPVEDLFGHWDPKPLASASIGQVHWAELKDGTPVAMKVHHPGIVEAMETDLKNANLVEAAMSAMGTAKFESKRLLEECRARFREELDYSLEASRQQHFREIHAEDPAIRIPKVFEEYSTGRVLTSEFFEGLPFSEARLAPVDDRRRWAEALWRFVYKATLVHGRFNADPHPGNYFFQPEGKVGFVDFGCVQPLADDRRLNAARLHKAANVGDDEGFRAAGMHILQTQGGSYEQMVVDYLRNAFRPITDSPFRITPDYAASVVNQFKRMCLDLLKSSDDGFVPMPPGILFINRLQFGFYSVLARLDVEVDYAAVEREYIDQAVS